MKDGKAETFEEWIARGQEMFKDDPNISLTIMTPDNCEEVWKTIEEAVDEDNG